MEPGIVIDTNVLVSALRSRLGASFRLLQLILEGTLEIYISVPVFLQYEDVLGRPELELPVGAEEVAVVLDAVRVQSVRREIYFLWRDTLADPGDAAFLELAISAQARYIVTYNIRHFQGSAGFGVRAVTPLQLLEIIGASS